jgi:hypothetical protein
VMERLAAKAHNFLVVRKCFQAWLRAFLYTHRPVRVPRTLLTLPSRSLSMPPPAADMLSSAPEVVMGMAAVTGLSTLSVMPSFEFFPPPSSAASSFRQTQPYPGLSSSNSPAYRDPALARPYAGTPPVSSIARPSEPLHLADFDVGLGGGGTRFSFFPVPLVSPRDHWI